jgi:hypothetical protein
MIIKNSIFWDITPCSLLKVDRRFGWTYLLLECRRIIQAKKKKQCEAGIKQMPVGFKCLGIGSILEYCYLSTSNKGNSLSEERERVLKLLVSRTLLFEILIRRYHTARATNYLFLHLVNDRLCGLVVRVSGYRSRGLGFDSRPYQIFWDVEGLERGPLSFVRTIGKLLEWKSSGSGLENRD